MTCRFGNGRGGSLQSGLYHPPLAFPLCRKYLGSSGVTIDDSFPESKNIQKFKLSQKWKTPVSDSAPLECHIPVPGSCLSTFLQPKSTTNLKYAH